MTQVLQARNLSLYEVEDKFNLRQITAPDFFPEWQDRLPDLTVHEKEALDRSREDFLSLLKYPLHEGIVKLTILAPLLSLAGLFRFPFHPQVEVEIQIAVADSDEIIRGRIDVQVLSKQLFAIVIEAKNKQFTIDVALPQALTYRMDSLVTHEPVYGLITNGNHFQFIKLVRQGHPQYGLSDQLTLANAPTGLYRVLQILKKLKGAQANVGV